jgi:hypothetical protein
MKGFNDSVTFFLLTRVPTLLELGRRRAHAIGVHEVGELFFLRIILSCQPLTPAYLRGCAVGGM